MEEGQLTAVDDQPIAKSDPALESLTDAQLQQKIGETIIQQKMEDDKTRQEINQAVNTAVQPQTTVTPPAPAPQITQIPAEPVKVHQEVQRTPEEQSAFAELQSKKGIKTADELASIYKNLQKDYTKKTQELAEIKRQPPVQQPPAQPVYQQPPTFYQGGDISYEQANEAFKQSLQTDPIGTLAQAITFIQDRSPQAEMIREQALSQEAIALATNPKTADFTSPEITSEIQTIISERPNEAVNLEKNLKRLFYEARGRVQDKVESRNIATGKQIQEQNILNKKSAAMETGNANTMNNSTVVDPNTMPLKDLQATIMRLSRSQ